MKKIYVVGIGLGAMDEMTVRAQKALADAQVIAGYEVYVDLIKPSFPDKTFITTPMRKEADRCAAALEAASQGHTVAVVCSGDAGIYGMAGLIYEMSEGSGAGIEVIPGVTAALSGAALLGAPLGHDCAIISLSDLLTPWEKIQRRLLAAAESDMCIVIYNPSSKKRADYLKRACDA
jgi:Precorrin-3B methylase